MTQKQLVIEYVKEFGSILPAKLGGEIYRGYMLGSETTKRCRELRDEGVLHSKPEGKFTRFYATSGHTAFEPKPKLRIMSDEEVNNYYKKTWPKIES